MPCLIQIGQIGDLLITIVMGNQYEVDHLNKPNSPNYTSKFKDSHRMQCIYVLYEGFSKCFEVPGKYHA